jgi:hypothetical protein
VRPDETSTPGAPVLDPTDRGSCGHRFFTATEAVGSTNTHDLNLRVGISGHKEILILIAFLADAHE